MTCKQWQAVQAEGQNPQGCRLTLNKKEIKKHSKGRAGKVFLLLYQQEIIYQAATVKLLFSSPSHGEDNLLASVNTCLLQVQRAAYTFQIFVYIQYVLYIQNYLAPVHKNGQVQDNKNVQSKISPLKLHLLHSRFLKGFTNSS